MLVEFSLINNLGSKRSCGQNQESYRKEISAVKQNKCQTIHTYNADRKFSDLVKISTVSEASVHLEIDSVIPGCSGPLVDVIPVFTHICSLSPLQPYHRGKNSR